MAIPNTTQIPNNLFNGEMLKMKDTELRITLIVARKTLGWIENLETGMRKEEDWISHSQLTKLTGRSSRALSTAIENCIKYKWIEARNEQGEILDTKQKRVGKRIFYRLGKIFLDKIETPEESKEVGQTSEKSSIEKSSIEKSACYKRNRITKETVLQNIPKGIGKTAPSYGNENINYLINLFKEKTGLIKLDGSEKQNRRYCWLALKKFGGRQKVEAIIKAALRSDFHRKNLTSFKYVYYNGVKIVNELKEEIEHPRIVKIR